MNKKLNTLLQELSDDNETTAEDRTGMPEDPKWPWLKEFQKYIDVIEQVPDGCSTIGWWGVSDWSYVMLLHAKLMQLFSSMHNTITRLGPP